MKKNKWWNTVTETDFEDYENNPSILDGIDKAVVY